MFLAKFFIFIPFSFLFFKRVTRRIKIFFFRPLFKKVGSNFYFDPNDLFSYQTIEVGNDVFIGSGACFAASETFIKIGDKVMFGPNVTIMGGDHNTSVMGKFMFDVKNKLPENDLPVIIENDVWIGTGVIILKGVTVKTGSIIAAGAVIIKDVQEYTIVGGVPGKFIKNRFTPEELINHKKLLAK